MTAGIARLVGRGAAVVSTDGKNLRASGPLPDDATAVEKAIHDALPVNNEASSLKSVQASVEAVMTALPKTVRPDQLASEALQLLNSSKITALIVVEADRPVGIVHFHDLLRAGVA